MITHDVDTLFNVCDRVAVLVNKGIVIDTIENIVHHPDPWIQDYFGDPRAVRARLGTSQATPHSNSWPPEAGD
jgi:phospholipid/cholesterol/gamma-HCH transport system ATP-binding protein